MGASKKLFDAIPTVRFNPAAITRLALDMVEEKLNGQFDLVDPTNPFMMLTEASATMASAAMTDAEAVLRKMYESMAVKEEELYLHMSDKDYLNRFAVPSRATISLFLSEDDVVRYAEASEVGNYRKIVIPKHTQFTAGDIPFTMQYPIEIRIKPHGGYDVVYGNSEISPIEQLTSNVVDWKIVRLFNHDFFRLNIPMRQMQITSFPNQLTLSTNYLKPLVFKDQFYYARAYRMLSNGQWDEMRTTHTDQVFDPDVPTVTLKVVGNSLSIGIPQVYIQKGMVDGEIRVDVYTTRGRLDVDLTALNPNAFSIAWRDLDNSVNSKYYSSIPNMEMTIIATGSTVGGRDRLDFETLRERVINNATGPVNVPITNVQVTSYLENLGYSVVTDVDNITNRDFLATRLLPPPDDGPVVSSAGLNIITLSQTMQQLAQLPTCKDNGDRLTILPSTLYRLNNGVVEIVPKVYVDSIQALPLETRVDRLNSEPFMYSPFHYVLDSTGDYFNNRPYYLDNPQIEDKNFIVDNDTAGTSVSTRRFAIERIEGGYRIYLEVVGDAVWDGLADEDCVCQLAFRPEGEVDLAYLNGTFAGRINNRRVYQFDLLTNFDINAEHAIGLTSFKMYNEPARTHYTALRSTFYVMYAAKNLPVVGIQPSIIDLELNKTELDPAVIGLTQESLTVVLGQNLQGLWAASRSVPSSLDYRRYTADVPAVYEQNVYERDATGAKVWTIDNGQVVFSILHHAGDPILDQDGNPTFKHRIGDIMLDQDGNPIVESSRNMLRQVDILTVDGLYYFVTELASVNYKNSIARLLTQWVSEDIAKAQEVLLEQSRLFFYPKVTLGMVNAWVLDNKRVRIDSQQHFKVTMYVDGNVYRDSNLRASLTVAARMAINDSLQKSVVSTDSIVEAIKERVGNDVIGFAVEGLGGATPYDTITLVDDSMRLSVGKRAVAHADGTLGVEDNVDVFFIRHRNE